MPPSGVALVTVPIAITVLLPAELIEAVALRAAEIVGAGLITNDPVSPWLYGAKAAAEYLGMPLGRIEKLQAAGRIPCHLVGERRYAYRRDELDVWVTESRT